MSESRGALLAKSVQKHAGRAKEKILQNLGKVDRTADEIFDDHLQNFTKQQNGANRLQKEFNNYIRCIRAAQTASKSLLEAIGEIYECQWTGHDLLYIQTQSIDTLWQDFTHKLGDQVLLPLNTYQQQFPETRKKIDKRGRKLVDYDSQRHNFQGLQANMKKRDDAKIAKGREQLDEAKRTYEVLNSELHDELPALYDSRILFLVTNLQSLFNTEHIFHTEIAKIYGELEAVIDRLATENQKSSYTIKDTNGTSLSHIQNFKTTSLTNSISPNDAFSHDPLSFPSKTNETNANVQPSSPMPSIKSESLNSYCNKPVLETNGSIKNYSSPPSPEPTIPETLNTTPNANDSHLNSANSNNIQEIYDIPDGASTDNLPPGVLYKVKATYKYNREDVDELSFDVGEIIQVIEYEDPDEQEEGWLMGVKENSGEKGMFPANFTRPL